MNRLKYILQHRYIIKVLAIIIIVFTIIYTNLYKKKSIYSGNEKEFIGIIYKQKVNEDKITLYIMSKEKLVINFYTKGSLNLNLGDKVRVTGIMKKPNNNTIPNIFNYKKYLYNNDIFYVVTAKKIEKISNNINIVNYLKNKTSKRINKILKSNEYIQIFLLGDTSLLDEEILDSYRINGISHLFSISGMHISLFAGFLLYILKRVSYNHFYNYFIVITFLVFYTLLVGSQPSVIRSLIMYILFSVNKLLNLKIKNIDLMFLLIIIIIIINPYYIYNIGFLYSYIISFTLILFNYKTKTIKNKFKKSMYISIISFLVSFPITIYNFYQINVISICLNIILIPLVSTIIFPLSIITFIIPKLSNILMFFITILEKTSLIISKYHIGTIIFSKPSLLLLIVYYILIYLFLYNYKFIYIFILMISHKLYIYIDPLMTVAYLDVGQGDSTLIKFPYNKGNILIDTGGILNSSYSFTKNKTIPYLKSIGINHLDYLILTHGDYDHMGEAINIVNNFKVEKIIFNCGTYNDLEKSLIEILNKKHIAYYSCIKELNIYKNKLQFLNTGKYDNENDYSNVIFFNHYNLKFLFMGDAGVEREKDIIDKYQLSNVDFLKIGHHGSNTSSSNYFINKINPKYSLISVGKNNWYGHPKNSVLDSLKESKIYRTDNDGSIKIKLNKNEYKIGTYPS